MDLQNTLTVITVGGLTVSFIAGITSQLWKGSVEIEGQFRKRLTPAGWLSLGITLVGLSGSIASELIRVSIRNNDRLQAKAEAAQRKTLQEQEARWRDEMHNMLTTAKKDIEKNVHDTVQGFEDSQRRFAQAQFTMAANRQELLESTVRHTNQIIVASQPLTSLLFRWEFSSTSAALWDTMTKGEKEIDENSRESQGGVTPVSFSSGSG
jgi:hypothetical protein